jgi:hypothetical protein
MDCCPRELQFSFVAGILSEYIGSDEKPKGNVLHILKYEW